MQSRAFPFPKLTAEEAASVIPHGATVGFSGFTPAGAVKAVPRAIAARAMRLHQQGESYQIRVLTGASTGSSLDEALAHAEAVAWRAPYQSSPTLRRQLNDNEAAFVDMHLSHLPQTVLAGFFGKVDFAVVEATEITGDGRVFLTTSVGASPTYLHCAEKVIIEVNAAHSTRTREMMDITILPPPPHRNPIPIHNPLSRIGWPYAVVDPAKVVGIVETNEPDEVMPQGPGEASYAKIAEHVVRFLADERKAGRIPREGLPLECGLGNLASNVLAYLGQSAELPAFAMYTESFQDACLDLMRAGKLTVASATSLTLSPAKLRELYDDLNFFAPKICLRPQELSNNPGIVRRLGVIAMNTALEVDIYGHANSTHVCGTNMLNGIGGSGDFTRNSFLSIFMCPSVQKGGRISTIVPMCPHVDHNEHSVQLVVTEYGLADLRGLAPIDRARRIINTCAHPAYRDYLNRYLEHSPRGHIRHDLARAFELHLNLLRDGAMLPGVEAG